MLKKTVLAKSLLIAFGTLALTGAQWAQAQTDAQPSATAPTQELERVVVTGSNIRRLNAETPSPVQVITADDMKKSGFTSTQEVLQSLTANGQGTLSQGFSGAFASGASGISLRGLNTGATLVLIDGHRMAPYPIGDDGQRSFVDISNIPFDAVERIEVLKDGASAVYGSDAIAGVVNIILKRSFVGKTITVDGGTSYKGDGTMRHVAGTFGVGDLGVDGHNFYVSGEYRRQGQITFAQRGGLLTQTDFTSTGGYNVTPGVVNDLNTPFPASGTGYIVDPNNSAAIAAFMPGCSATALAANQCTFRDTWDQVIPPTENLNLVARYTQSLGDDWQLSVQGTYFEGKAQQAGAPASAFSGGYQGVTSGPGVIPALVATVNPTTISSTNPSFPAGTGLSSGLLYYNFLALGPTLTNTVSRASRAVADLQGSLGAWDISASLGYTQVLLGLTGLNYVQPANLQTALDSTTAPYLVGQANSAAVDAFIAPVLTSHDVSKLSFAHLGASRELMKLGGGPLQIALGTDYFHREQNAVAPTAVADGLVPGFSNNFTVGEQNVASADAEIDAPFTKQFEMDGAVRYDHYNLSGGKASPKIGFKYTPVKEVALRGTASRGFRAPGPAENGNAGQTYYFNAIPDPQLCANGDPTTAGNFPSQCHINPPYLQGTNPQLKPETSKSYTFGVILEPMKELNATVDLWSIEIDNQIISGGPTNFVRGTNFTAIPQTQADGTTALVVPPVAPIAYQSVGYINANTTKTSGVDFGLQFAQRLAAGVHFKSDFQVSYTGKYDLTIDGTTYHLAGTHGPVIVGGDTGNPKMRIQWANTFAQGPWSVTGTISYISSFNLTDPSVGLPDCLSALSEEGGAAGTDYQAVLNNGQIPSAVSCKVGSFTTFNLEGHYDLTKQFSLHASIQNLFNRSFPADWATYGGALGLVPYNPSLHEAGAIGRYFNVGATYNF